MANNNVYPRQSRPLAGLVAAAFMIDTLHGGTSTANALPKSRAEAAAILTGFTCEVVNVHDHYTSERLLSDGPRDTIDVTIKTHITPKAMKAIDDRSVEGPLLGGVVTNLGWDYGRPMRKVPEVESMYLLKNPEFDQHSDKATLHVAPKFSIQRSNAVITPYVAFRAGDMEGSDIILATCENTVVYRDGSWVVHQGPSGAKTDFQWEPQGSQGSPLESWVNG
jgi:hypothetical protein